MKFVRTALKIGGVLAFLLGLLWMGQGTGYFPWPGSSFMIGASEWTIRGAGVAVAGLVAILVARRMHLRR